jgi:hypothetical protein
MKKTRFTEEQMVTILREADEKSVPELAKKLWVSFSAVAKQVQGSLASRLRSDAHLTYNSRCP